MQVSVPGMYQNPAPYREQTLTYSTALAFTGRSAACAPPPATKAAAEPRTRLLIIFILNLQVALSSEGSGPRRFSPSGLAPQKPISRFAPSAPASCAGTQRTTSRDDPESPAVVGEYACTILIMKLVYAVS